MSPMHDEKAKKEQKERMKRIKNVTTSALMSNPSLEDNTSEIISKMGAMLNASNNERK